MVALGPTQQAGARSRGWPFQLPLRAPWLVLLGFGLQVFAVRMSTGGALTPLRTALICVAWLPLLAWVRLNWRRSGVKVVALGLGLNLAVMLANGGLMPVTAGAIRQAGLTQQLSHAVTGQPLPRSKDVLMTPASTRLALLRDAIVMRPSNAPGYILSPGDVVLFAGLLWTLIALIPWRSRLLRPRTARAGLRSTV